MKLNEVVEVIFVDEGVIWEASHPMHLHGYSFRVVANERVSNMLHVLWQKHAHCTFFFLPLSAIKKLSCAKPNYNVSTFGILIFVTFSAICR